MSLPVGLSTVAVTVSALHPDGTALKGAVTFTPNATLRSGTYHVSLAGPVTLTFSGNGTPQTATLVATDAAGVLPSGWTYTVTEWWQDAPSRTYSIALPAASPAVYLADLAPVSADAGFSVFVPPTGVGINLANLGLSNATTDIRVLLDAAVAAGARKIIVPYRAAAWPMLTKWTASNVWLDFEPGARISFNMTDRAMDLTNVRLTGASFTSTFTGPASSADATDALTYEYPARSVVLNDYCVVENHYGEYQTTGLDITGAHVRFRNVRFKNIRHRQGWGNAVHLHGTNCWDVLGWGVQVEDSDRGIEIEDGAHNVNIHGGHLKNVYPNGYTGSGSAPTYATYTFVLDAHAHTGTGGVQNIRYSGEWTLENCGGGVTFVRSNGTNDADYPRNCSAEKVRVIGRGMSTGYNAIAIMGHSNTVESFSLETGAGVAGTLHSVNLQDGTDLRIGEGRAEGFSLPLVTVASNATDCVIGRVVPLDAAISGSGWLYDVAGPRTVIDGATAQSVGGTLGYLRLQATATESRVRRFAYTLKSGETFTDAISDLSSNSEVTRQAASPVMGTTLRAGKFLSLPNRTITTSNALGNGTLRLTPVYFPRPITIDQLGANITAAGDAGCVLRIGVFADAAGLPGSVLADVTVPADAIANPMTTLGTPLKLAAGWYHVGGVVQGVTVTQPTVSVTTTAIDGFLIFNPSVTTVAPVGYSKGGITTALSAYGTTISTSNLSPRIWARVT